jgi:hypothetical protein
MYVCNTYDLNTIWIWCVYGDEWRQTNVDGRTEGAKRMELDGRTLMDVGRKLWWPSNKLWQLSDGIVTDVEQNYDGCRMELWRTPTTDEVNGDIGFTGSSLSSSGCLNTYEGILLVGVGFSNGSIEGPNIDNWWSQGGGTQQCRPHSTWAKQCS